MTIDNQIKVLESYVGEIVFGSAILSPLRDDNKPSFCFYNNDDRITFYDFAKKYSGDTMSFVMEIEDCSYKEAKKIVAEIIKSTSVKPRTNKVTSAKKRINELEPSLLIRNYFEDYEVEYWLERGVTTETLVKEWIFPNDGLFYKDSLIVLSDKGNPSFTYLYERGSKAHKVYTPYDKNNKWKSFDTSRFGAEGLHTLDIEKENLVILSSTKDRLVFSSMFPEYAVINPIAEGIFNNMLNFIEPLEFSNVYCIFDADSAGIELSDKLCSSAKFKINNIKLPNDYGKDIDEMYIKNKEKCKEILCEQLKGI